MSNDARATQQTLAEIRDMRRQRTEAVAAAYPDMRPDRVNKWVEWFYRGKPNTGHIRRILLKAGLL